jgi:hypothetical protein
MGDAMLHRRNTAPRVSSTRTYHARSPADARHFACQLGGIDRLAEEIRAMVMTVGFAAVVALSAAPFEPSVVATIV